MPPQHRRATPGGANLTVVTRARSSVWIAASSQKPSAKPFRALRGQLSAQSVAARGSGSLRLKLKTEPGGAVPFYSGLRVSNVTQEPPLNVAALPDVDPLEAAKETVDPRRTRCMRSNGCGGQRETIFLRKRHRRPHLILAHNRDGRRACYRGTALCSPLPPSIAEPLKNARVSTSGPF